MSGNGDEKVKFNHSLLPNVNEYVDENGIDMNDEIIDNSADEKEEESIGDILQDSIADNMFEDAEDNG